MNGNAIDGILMCGIVLQQLIHPDIPDLYRVVRRTRGNTQAIRVERYVIHGTGGITKKREWVREKGRGEGEEGNGAKRARGRGRQ